MFQPPSPSQVDRFAQLFKGYDRAYGQYTVTEQEQETGKNVGPRNTKVGNLTLDHYTTHLHGTGPGLGVVMLLPDNRVWFAAADIDNYRLDIPALENRVRQLRLPLVVCRTKSGGAHLYLFFREPAPAETVRNKLAEWVALLNLSNRTEIFPKQSARANPNDIGSWINIPYQNVPGPTVRFAVNNGRPMVLEDFLQMAESMRITAAQLGSFAVNNNAEAQEDDPLYEAPPCLVTIQQQGGLREGTRNDGMMAVGVYLKKRYGDSWENHLRRYNDLMCSPPLSQSELDELASSLRKRDYFYRCRLPPIAAVCQQRACAKRKHGVGGDDENPAQIEALAVNGLTQYAYPGEVKDCLWALEMCGVRLMVTTEVLLNPSAMASNLVEQGRILPSGLSTLSKPKWHKYLEPIIKSAERMDMSIRTGGPSPFWETIVDVLRTAQRAKDQAHFLSDPDRLCWQQGTVIRFTFSMLRRYLSYRSRKPITDMLLTDTLEGYGAKMQVYRGLSLWELSHEAVVNTEITTLPTTEAF
jgi:hypothetical protein